MDTSDIDNSNAVNILELRVSSSDILSELVEYHL